MTCVKLKAWTMQLFTFDSLSDSGLGEFFSHKLWQMNLMYIQYFKNLYTPIHVYIYIYCWFYSCLFVDRSSAHESKSEARKPRMKALRVKTTRSGSPGLGPLSSARAKRKRIKNKDPSPQQKCRKFLVYLGKGFQNS